MTDDPRNPEEILAERINTLLDVVAAEGGTRPQFPEIRDAMAERGVSISRQRWHYMRAGSGPMTTDRRLLAGLADFFGVPLSYLVDISPTVPPRVSAQLGLLKSMKEAEVRTFAARSLTSELSTETLLAVRSIIDEALRGDGSPSEHG